MGPRGRDDTVGRNGGPKIAESVGSVGGTAEPLGAACGKGDASGVTNWRPLGSTERATPDQALGSPRRPTPKPVRSSEHLHAMHTFDAIRQRRAVKHYDPDHQLSSSRRSTRLMDAGHPGPDLLQHAELALRRWSRDPGAAPADLRAAVVRPGSGHGRLTAHHRLTAEPQGLAAGSGSATGARRPERGRRSMLVNVDGTVLRGQGRVCSATRPCAAVGHGSADHHAGREGHGL